MDVLVLIEIYTTLIFAPFHYVMSICFAFIPSFLRMFGITTLSLGVGKVLDLFDSKKILGLKYFIYAWFLAYSIYLFDLFSQIAELNILTLTTSVLSILGAIFLIILGKFFASRKIKGYKLFNYYTLMLAFMIISIAWWYFYGDQVNLDYVLFYSFGSMIIVGLIRAILNK